MSNMGKSMEEFNQLVRDIVFATAHSKGYASNPEGDGRDLLDFIEAHFHGHAEGEMVYKIVRWEKKRNPEDLLKLVAWAFLVWDQDRRNYESKQGEMVDQATPAPYPDHREPNIKQGYSDFPAPDPSFVRPSVESILDQLYATKLSPPEAIRLLHAISERARA